MTARRLLVVALLANLLGACVSVPPEPYDEVVVVAPPPPRVEYPGYPPYPGYVWIDGYWSWGGRQHAWVPGRWAAPRPGYVWVAPRWIQDGRRWRMHDGRWERQPPGRMEVPPPRPIPGGRGPGDERRFQDAPPPRPGNRPDVRQDGLPRAGGGPPPRSNREVRQPPRQMPDGRGDIRGLRDGRWSQDARPTWRQDTRPDAPSGRRPDFQQPGVGARPDAPPRAREDSPRLRGERETRQSPRQPPAGEARAPRQSDGETRTRRADEAGRQRGNDAYRPDYRSSQRSGEERRGRAP
jgi:hypothetical protein